MMQLSYMYQGSSAGSGRTTSYIVTVDSGESEI